MSELDDLIVRRTLVLPHDADHAVIRRINRRLETLQEIVGGWIEGLTLTDQVSAYINEEGKLIGLPLNRNGDVVVKALLASTGHTLMPGDVIVGTVVLMGPPDEEGWDTDLPDSAIELVRSMGIQIIEEEA